MEEPNIPVECSECGEKEFMPYECKFCGQKFCAEHRLPENHDCPGLERHKQKMREEGRMFQKKEVKAPEASSRGAVGFLSYFKNNMAYVFLGIIVVNFLIQQTILEINQDLAIRLFYLSGDFVSRPWTLITSVFSHSGPFHLLVNGIVLFFFGPMLEKTLNQDGSDDPLMGTKRFTLLFLSAGILSGMVQVMVFEGHAVLGASGAIAAVLGAQTVFTPRMKILLMFIPMELWIATIFFILYNIAFVGRGGVANLAHLVGMGLGISYGYYLKDKIRIGGFGSQNYFRGRRRR